MTPAARLETRHEVPLWIGAAAALSLLAIRPSLVVLFPATAVLAGLYLLVLTMSTAGPGVLEKPRLNRGAVLAAGVAAVALVGIRSAPIVRVGIAATPLLLNTLAAISEEAVFRRLLYERFLRWGSAAAVLLTAALFALVHVPAYGWAALPLDLGAGLLFGWQRWASGSWLVPAATHVAANLVVMLR